MTAQQPSPGARRTVVRHATPDDHGSIARLPGLSASTHRSLASDLHRAVADRADAAAVNGSPGPPTVALVAVAAGEPPGPAPGAGGPAAGPVLGVALGVLQHDEGHVLDLAVDTDARGRGTGGRLLAALVGALRHLGAVAVTLEVRAGNDAALALYRRAGFVVEGRRRGYYPDGEDALVCWWRPSATRGGDG